MNTKSLLTRIAVPVLSLGLLGGLGAALATSAGASTLPAATMASVTTTLPFHQASGVTYLANRDDGGNGSVNGGNWALDDMTRYLTVKLVGESGGTYTYTATIRDFGQFHAVLGDDTPNQSGQYLIELITNPPAAWSTATRATPSPRTRCQRWTATATSPSRPHRWRRRLDRRLV